MVQDDWSGSEHHVAHSMYLFLQPQKKHSGKCYNPFLLQMEQEVQGGQYHSIASE